MIATVINNSSLKTNYYSIPTATLKSGGLDLTHVTLIAAVIDPSLVGAGMSGTLDIFAKGIFFQTGIIGSATGTPSALPNVPKVVKYSASQSNTFASVLSTRDFSVAYNISRSNVAGGTISFDDASTVPVESANLSGLSTWVFRVNGTPKKVKVVVEDVNAKRSQVILPNTDNAATPYYSIPSSMLTNGGVNLSAVRYISFVVDTNLTGNGAANNGSFKVSTGGVLALFVSPSASTLPLTVLPRYPVIDKLSGSYWPTVFYQMSTNHSRLTYVMVMSSTWSGATIRFDDFGTPQVETADLSGLPSLVFGLQATPSSTYPVIPTSLKLEIKDYSSNTEHTVSVDIVGITNSRINYFKITNTLLAGIDLTKVRFISFVADSSHVASGWQSVDIWAAGLSYQRAVMGSAASNFSPMPSNPKVLVTGGSQIATSVAASTSDLTLSYNISSADYAGATIAFDNYLTQPIESADLSSLPALVFKLVSTPHDLQQENNVKLEVLDANSKKASIILKDSDHNWSYIYTNSTYTYSSNYTIPTSLITSAGVDMAHVTAINFIVDNNLTSGDNQGTFHVVTGGGLQFDDHGLAYGSATGIPTPLPNLPKVIPVGGSPASTIASTISTSDFTVTYSIANNEWSGGTILFDDYGTVPIETADLSALSSLFSG